MSIQNPGHYHDFGEPKDDYTFESAEEGKKAYMTGRRKGVRQGDYIRIQKSGQTQIYKVLSIEYYSSPNTIWTALLTQIN